MADKALAGRWSDTEFIRLWRSYYSNVSRGKRQKENQDNLIPYILEPRGSSKEYRKNWARLIQKIYEVDPPKCHGKMRILSFIEDEEIIKKILKHRGLWDVKQRPTRHHQLST